MLWAFDFVMDDDLNLFFLEGNAGQTLITVTTVTTTIIGTITADNFQTNAGTDIVTKTLTIGRRSGAESINLVGTGMTLALRSGVGTADF